LAPADTPAGLHLDREAGAVRGGRLWMDMKTFTGEITRQTKGNSHVVNITQDVQALIRQSGIREGQLTAMVIGSTAALTTLEFEPGLVNTDVAAMMERIAPEDGAYVHEATWGDDNGHSHLRAALMGPSLAMPVVDGHAPLGTWQQVVLVDFDTRPRQRRVVVNIIGE
ncbi:MAG: secondary thiamine-phosphate synthase enzyme YjbQ, partial [Verrucomicrobiae bacterium]|nr:secondary thiamine-phosphate synthase enzyme YjbQ [Verrucomicrobiae bacterium]